MSTDQSDAILVTTPAGDFARANAIGLANMTTPKSKIDLSTGICMAYREIGPESGPTIILVHGLVDSVRSWSTTMAALASENPSLHILAIDLRGHGSSSMPSGAECALAPEKCFTVEDFSNDLAAFMNAKKLTKATIVGHSLGSFIAQEMALVHPELTERVILVGTSVRGAGNVILQAVLRDQIEGSWKSALEAKGKSYPTSFYEMTPLEADPAVETWLAKNLVVDPVADPDFVAPHVREVAAVKLGTWIGATKALLTIDNTERLRNLRTPTLVLWATQDNIFPPDSDQAAVKDVLGTAAQTNGIPVFVKQYGRRPLPASGDQEDDIGHNIQWGAPLEVARDINSFIVNGLPTPGLPHSDFPKQITGIVVDARSEVEQFA